MKTANKRDLIKLVQGLKKHKRFLLSCHVTPEGDAIGSMLAMESLLRRMGKKTQVVCQDPFPERLSCLSNRKWMRTSELKKNNPGFDALVLTDCPTLARIGDVRSILPKDIAIFNIDHHISNDRFGNYNFIRPEAAASAEVVLDIFNYLKLKLTRDEAKNLYVGLATDTGSFKYSNTRAESHVMAAKLIATGLDIEKINDELHGAYSLKTMKLYSRLLGRVKTAAGGALAWSAMSRRDLKETGAGYEDAEGFIDFVRYLKGSKVSFFLTELSDGKSVRVSFRAKGPYDVNRVATFFNGGGHKKASGCTIRASVAEAERQIVKRILSSFHFKPGRHSA